MSCLSVRPTALMELGSHWTDFRHIFIIIMFKKRGVRRAACSLTFRNRSSYTYIVRAHRYPPNTPFYVFFQQVYILNFLNMLHTLHLFLFKMPFIS
jgi:predicted acetyltransferase